MKRLLVLRSIKNQGRGVRLDDNKTRIPDARRADVTGVGAWEPSCRGFGIAKILKKRQSQPRNLVIWWCRMKKIVSVLCIALFMPVYVRVSTESHSAEDAPINLEKSAQAFSVERCVTDSCGTAPPIIITDNHGGVLLDFMQQNYKYETTGQRIIVRGVCESACTIFLHNPRTCAEPTARFGFHAGWYRNAKTLEKADNQPQNGVPISFHTEVYLSMMPMPVRRWIERHGGLTQRKFLVLEGAEMRSIVPQCTPSFGEGPDPAVGWHWMPGKGPKEDKK